MIRQTHGSSIPISDSLEMPRVTQHMLWSIQASRCTSLNGLKTYRFLTVIAGDFSTLRTSHFPSLWCFIDETIMTLLKKLEENCQQLNQELTNQRKHNRPVNNKLLNPQSIARTCYGSPNKVCLQEPAGYQHVDASESTRTKLGSHKQVYKNLYGNQFSLNFLTLTNYRIYQLKKKKNPYAIIMFVLIKSWVVANQ